MVQLRAFVGPQLLLDVLRVHICTAAAGKSSATARLSTKSSTVSQAVVDGRVSPSKGGSAGAGAAAVVATPTGPLQRCVDACMRMLQAMLRAELTSPDKGALLSASLASVEGGRTRHGSSFRDYYSTSLRDGSVYGDMPFLEGGFGDGFDVDGGGFNEGEGDKRAGDEATDSASGVKSAPGGKSPAVTASTAGMNAAVVCLQECQSLDLQRGLLRVLLGLREERPNLLRRALLR